MRLGPGGLWKIYAAKQKVCTLYVYAGTLYVYACTLYVYAGTLYVYACTLYVYAGTRKD